MNNVPQVGNQSRTFGATSVFEPCPDQLDEFQSSIEDLLTTDTGS